MIKVDQSWSRLVWSTLINHNRSDVFSVSRTCVECDKTCSFKHLLLECKRTELHRDKFYSNISNVLPEFKYKEFNQQFRDIMNLEYGQLSTDDYNLVVSMSLAFVDTIYKSFV